MNAELSALEMNDTWDLVPLPPGKKPIGCRWVYKIKCKPDGTVDKYKARLVAKGYNQIEGLDFHDVFSPVAKNVTVRLLLALTAAHSWHLHQLDVNNAFLHGPLDEDVYMSLPEGYQTSDSSYVCKLKKSLYGLKQASRQWNHLLTDKLIGFGFTQSKHDHCLFLKHSASDFLALLVYVDDVLLVGTSSASIQEVKRFLDDQFTIKDLGEAKYFLGIELFRSSAGLALCQRKYSLDIIADVGLTNAKPVSTPLPSGCVIPINDASAVLLLDPGPYRHLIGRLLYLSFTRPDLTYVVQQLSHFL